MLFLMWLLKHLFFVRPQTVVLVVLVQNNIVSFADKLVRGLEGRCVPLSCNPFIYNVH